MRLSALLAFISLVGCAQPSRQRLAELLGECREHNREHLRMLREYEARGQCRGVEQGFGSAEAGLGGW